MANSERPLSFLPTIKCSSCGVEIDISHLADHVCAPSSSASKCNPKPAHMNHESDLLLEATEPTAPKLDRAATFSASRFNSSTSNIQARSQRGPPPPRIDPSAASECHHLSFHITHTDFADKP